MDVLEAIKTRRSIRKYTEELVSWDDIGAIVEAGKSAPSAGNLQNWKFLVVKNEAKRKAIADACLQQHWMASAPVHIIVVAVPRKAVQFYGIRGERLYSIQNCAAACQNILIAAHYLKLGACWVGAFDEDALKRSVGISEEGRPQAVITIGHPAESPPEPMHLSMETVVYLENWGSKIKDMPAVLGLFGEKLQSRLGESIDVSTGAVKKGIAKLKERFRNK